MTTRKPCFPDATGKLKQELSDFDSTYKTFASSSKMKLVAWRVGGRHEVPTLTEELLVIESYREREGQFSQECDYWQVDHSPWQALSLRTELSGFLIFKANNMKQGGQRGGGQIEEELGELSEYD